MYETVSYRAGLPGAPSLPALPATDRSASRMSQSTAEGGATASWWAAAFFAAGLVIGLLMYRRGIPARDGNADAAPVVDM